MTSNFNPRAFSASRRCSGLAAIARPMVLALIAAVASVIIVSPAIAQRAVQAEPVQPPAHSDQDQLLVIPSATAADGTATDASADSADTDAEIPGPATPDADEPADDSGMIRPSTADPTPLIDVLPPVGDVPVTSASLPDLTVRDLNILIIDKFANQANARSVFKSTLPSSIITRRGSESGEFARWPMPIGTITFDGPACEIDVLIELDNGAFLAADPGTRVRNDRLLWKDLKLTTEADDPNDLPANHWLAPYRDSDHLWVTARSKTERVLLYDVMLAVDGPGKIALDKQQYTLAFPYELPLAVAVQTSQDQQAGKVAARRQIFDPYEPANRVPAGNSTSEPPTAPAPPAPEPAQLRSETQVTPTRPAAVVRQVADVDHDETRIIRPRGVVAVNAQAEIAEEAPIRVIRPGGREIQHGAAPVRPSQPANSEDGDDRGDESGAASVELTLDLSQAPSISVDQLLDPVDLYLDEVGFNEATRQIAIKAIRRFAIDPNQTVFIYALPRSQIDKQLPMTITPTPGRVERHCLVVAMNFDPQIESKIQKLIKQLGDPSWAKRHAAQTQLEQYGQTAEPMLKGALKSDDAETVHRVNQLLDHLKKKPNKP